jgi:hypothetical protein
MKRFLLVLIVVVVPASAQWRHFGRPSFQSTEPTGYIGIGIAQPVNPLANRLNTGFTLAGGVGVTQPYAGVMFDVMFSDLGINDANLLLTGARRGNQKYWSFTVDPVLHVNPRGPVDFYITGGGGLYGQNTKLKTTFVGPQNSGFDLTRSDTVYGPGVNGGAGFSFGLSDRSRVKFFTEARYHHMFLQGRDADLIPVTVGVRF